MSHCNPSGCNATQKGLISASFPPTVLTVSGSRVRTTKSNLSRMHPAPRRRNRYAIWDYYNLQKGKVNLFLLVSPTRLQAAVSSIPGKDVFSYLFDKSEFVGMCDLCAVPNSRSPTLERKRRGRVSRPEIHHIRTRSHQFRKRLRIRRKNAQCGTGYRRDGEPVPYGVEGRMWISTGPCTHSPTNSDLQVCSVPYYHITGSLLTVL